MSEQRIPEEVRVQGSQLVERVRDLLHQGNIRRIQIRHEGRTVLEIPLTVAAVGVLVAPVIAALGAFAALATECTIVVERIEDEIPAGTAGDTWAELSPAANPPPVPEEGTMGGIVGMESTGSEAGIHKGAATEPPNIANAPGEPDKGPNSPSTGGTFGTS